MDELRASQAKKISPNAIDFAATRSLDHDTAHVTVTERSAATHQHTASSFDMSKSFSQRLSTEYNHLDELPPPAPNSVAENLLVNQSSNSSGIVNVSTSSSIHTSASLMARSMSGLSIGSKLPFGAGTAINNTSISSSAAASTTTTSTATAISSTLVSTASTSSAEQPTAASADSAGHARKPRPTSVSLRNRSSSPIGRQLAALHISGSPPVAGKDATPPPPATAKEAGAGVPVTTDNVCPRVAELEQRVARLERVVQQQHAVIEEAQRTARDEAERVRALRAELDKYAQFVTQV